MGQAYVEMLPVEDVFITSLGKVEPLGNGLVRVILCVEDSGVNVVKCRLVIPVKCAVEMNDAAAAILLAEYRKAYPLRIVT